MTAPQYVILHTEPDGRVSTLSVVVYADLTEAEKRVAERTRAAAEFGWPDTYRVFELREVPERALTSESLKTPCSEGFHWIGQSFATCDLCALPAWDHEGLAMPAKDNPFETGWVLKPWKPGECEAVKAKWAPTVKDGVR